MNTIRFPELDEARGKLAERQKRLGDIMAQAGHGGEGTLDLKAITLIDGDSAAKVEQIRALNDETTELAEQVKKLEAVHSIAANPTPDHVASGDGSGAPEGTKDVDPFGAIVKSQAFTNKGAKSLVDGVTLKTLFETSAGWAPESVRSGVVVPDAQRPVQVTDLLPQIPTSQAAYKYMEETTFTNSAAERAEGAAYAESAFELTERSVTIESVGTFVPVTDEQLEDVAGAEEYLRSRLAFAVRQRVDSQILVGDGNTPNIEGINEVSGIQTQALGADPVPDAVHKAITKVRVTGRAMPNAVIFHPNDWQGVRLLRTTDGIYIWGSPSEPGPAVIWGLQVVQSDAQTENTAVVGDFANYSALVTRRGLEVRISDSHSDYFVKGKQALRAGVRLATVWYRPAAFCTVTGI